MEKTQRLQERILLASRWDIGPTAIVDYQTVYLGQPKMREAGWTTRGVPEHRDGSPSAKFGTHQRYRHYLANGVLTSVIALKSSNHEFPDISAVESALVRPARPLFIGRKACLPSSRILIGRYSGENILAILQKVPCSPRKEVTGEELMAACWPAESNVDHIGEARQIFDMRDWRSQLHMGSRYVVEGFIKEETSCS